MDTYGNNDVGLARCGQEAGVQRRSANRAVAVFVLAALLLNGEALRDSISRKPYGRTRDVMLTLVEPVAALSRWTGLARLRARIETGRDRVMP